MSLLSHRKERATHLRDVASRVASHIIKLATIPSLVPTSNPEVDILQNSSDDAWKKVAVFGTALNVCWFLSGSRAILKRREAEQFRKVFLELLSDELYEWADPEISEALVKRFTDDLDFLDDCYTEDHEPDQRATKFTRRLSSAFREEGIEPPSLQILVMCDVQLKTARRLGQIAKEFL